MAKEISKEDETKMFAFVGVLLTVIGFIVVVFARRNDAYAMHYAKQGLIIFIAGAIISVLSMLLELLPVIGSVITRILWLALLILWIIGIVYSFSGEKKNIPLIGQYARMIPV